MKLMMFSVLDAAVATFERPFFCRTPAEAVRMMRDAVQERESPFARHPSDFSLFKVGEFEQSTGVVFELAKAEKIVDIVALLQETSL